MQATEHGWIKRFSQTGSGTSRVPHATPTIAGSAQEGDAESCAAVEGPLIRPWSGGSNRVTGRPGDGYNLAAGCSGSARSFWAELKVRAASWPTTPIGHRALGSRR